MLRKLTFAAVVSLVIASSFAIIAAIVHKMNELEIWSIIKEWIVTLPISLQVFIFTFATVTVALLFSLLVTSE